MYCATSLYGYHKRFVRKDHKLAFKYLMMLSFALGTAVFGLAGFLLLFSL